MHARTSPRLSSLSLSLLFSLAGCAPPAACPEGTAMVGDRCQLIVGDAGTTRDGAASDAPLARTDAAVPFAMEDAALEPGPDAAPAPDACALRTLHRDADGDGRGDPTMPMTLCGELAGWVLDATDCDDACATCFLGAEETCNEVDDDCDGSTDEGVRLTFYRDADGDGRGSLVSGRVEACEIPEGHSPFADDCDDARASAYPGATETCNGLDDDCDTTRDETFACVAGGTVACRTMCGTTGTAACSTSCMPSATCIPPAETCNGLDDDCNGWVDEGLRTFGPSVTAGPAGRRIEVLPYSGGFVAIYQNEGGILARRFDATGSPVGPEQSIHRGSVPDFGAAIWMDSLFVVTKGASDLVGYRFDLTPSFTPILGPVPLGAGDVSVTNRIRVALVLDQLHVVFPALLSSSGSARALFVLRRTHTFTGTTERFSAFSLATTSDDFDVFGGDHLYVASVFVGGSTRQLNLTRIPSSAASGSMIRAVTVPTDGAVPRVPQIAVQTTAGERAVAAVLYQREGAASVRLAVVRIGRDGSMDASGPDAVVGSSALSDSSPPAPSDVVPLGDGRFGLAYLVPSATGATVQYSEARVPETGAPLLRGPETLETFAATAGSLSLARNTYPNPMMLGLSPAGFSTARVRVRACP